MLEWIVKYYQTSKLEHNVCLFVVFNNIFILESKHVTCLKIKKS